MKQNKKSIGIYKSLIYFGIPGIVLYFSMYYFVPVLLEFGVSEAIGVFGSMWLVTIPLIILGYIIYKRESKITSIKGFFAYFHFKKLKRKDVLYIVIGILVSVVAEGTLEGLGKYFAQFSIFAPPNYLSAPFNPLKERIFPFESFMGISLKGKWLFLLIFIPLHLLAMIGEEIIWRGYLLPRQEIRYGKYAWVLNGLLWAWVLHSCLKWNFISMLPSMLITPYMAQKTRNTTVAYVIHVVPNMMIWIIIFIGILGLG